MNQPIAVDARPAGCAVLVAQHFPPINIIAAQRALRMAEVLLERYGKVYVVCLDSTGRDPRVLDHDFGREVVSNPRLVRLMTAPLLPRYGVGVGGSVVQTLAGGVATRLLCGPGVDWIPALKRALAAIPQADLRLVVASGSPFIPFGAVVEWSNRRRVPVILDYRDLWTRHPHAPYPRIARRVVNALFERPANRRATMLTTVSEGCRTMLADDAGGTPVRTVYNAPSEAYRRFYRTVVGSACASTAGRGDGTFTIVYTGQVYRTCTFAALLQAMTGLPQQMRSRIRVHYYGYSSELVRGEFAAAGFASALIDHGIATKETCLRAIADADLLVSLIHTDRMSSDPAVTGLISTKIYDYFLSGLPILNIGPINGELNALAAKIAYCGFHTFPAQSVSEIRDFLQGALGRPARARPSAAPRLPDFTSEFGAVIEEAEASAR